jgi:energy-coupling factor transporter ATP-binding protein EcfA2
LTNFGCYTVFVIDHRLRAIRNADLVLVLNEGEIIERGKYAELLAKKDFYYNLSSISWPSSCQPGVTWSPSKHSARRKNREKII